MASTLELDALHVPGSKVTFDVGVQFTYEQKFSPKWSVEDSYGKMDGIPFYSNTTREIEVYFELIAKSTLAARAINRQIDLLTKLQYPKYKGVGAGSQRTFAGAPFFRMSAKKSFSRGSSPGSYQVFPEVAGYITSLIITPGVKDGYNVTIDPENNAAYQSKFTVQFTFKVLHEILPGWTENNVFTETAGGFYATFAEPTVIEQTLSLGGKYLNEAKDLALSAYNALQNKAVEEDVSSRSGVTETLSIETLQSPAQKKAADPTQPAKITSEPAKTGGE